MYLTTTGASVRSVDELAFYLGERLPKFMVPSEFNVLDSMPLGATGKIDRRGLIS